MKWDKKGLIVKPEFGFNWMVTHAQLPIAERLEEDMYRIYFAGRNRHNMSQIGYVEIDINNPQKILYITENPILELGPLGSFDDSGVYPSWIINHNKKKYLYYIGWTQTRRVPWTSCLGLAISIDDGKTFNKISMGPLFDKNDIDPYLTTSACVRIEDEVWRMWYTSGVRWEIINDVAKPFYHIKYAESKDGQKWERNGQICIDFKDKDENKIARPCVIKEDDIYKMWYSHSPYSDESYRIGYAESNDGLHWERMDEKVGINISKSGWDSEMIAYPFVFDHNNKKYLLYNGNGYGKNGIGLAIEVKNE